MLNTVALTGRLTKAIDLRYTQSGTAVGSFNLAVDRKFRNQNGERETDFINCQIWRKSAENLANFTHKGSLIGLEGHIQTRTYDNSQGQKVYVTEVVVDNFALLEPKNANTNHQNQQVPQPPVNQNPPQQNDDPFGNNSKPIDISDEDLPF